MTLTLTSLSGNFNLDGSDDQCGATNKGSAVGVGIFNAVGNVTLNFTIVTAPGAKPVHVSAIVSPANGSGTWTDSVGNSGTFAFFGNVPGLPARPLPASGLAAAVITTTELAPNAVTGAQVANGSLSKADLIDAPRAATSASDQTIIAIPGGTAVVRSVTLSAPTAGVVLVSAHTSMRFAGTTAAQDVGQCSITTGTTIDNNHQIIASDGGSTQSFMYIPVSGTRLFAVSAGSFTVNFVCEQFTGSVGVVDSGMTALFIAQ